MVGSVSDNKDDAKVAAVKKALASEKVKDYINKELALCQIRGMEKNRK